MSSAKMTDRSYSSRTVFMNPREPNATDSVPGTNTTDEQYVILSQENVAEVTNSPGKPLSEAHGSVHNIFPPRGANSSAVNDTDSVRVIRGRKDEKSAKRTLHTINQDTELSPHPSDSDVSRGRGLRIGSAVSEDLKKKITSDVKVVRRAYSSAQSSWLREEVNFANEARLSVRPDENLFNIGIEETLPQVMEVVSVHSIDENVVTPTKTKVTNPFSD